MSKTCKKLLASALAATMLFSTFVSSLVVSAAATGTLEIGTKTITVGTESATVDFTLTFSEAVTAPHDLATIVAKNANEETLTITAAELGEVVYVVDGVEQNTPYIDGIAPDDEVEPPSVSVESTNLTAGKILFGSGVASAADVKVINFTVTFDTTTATVGTYTVTATTDGTDYDEADIVVTTEDGAIVVEEAHVCAAGDLVNNGDGTHDVKCSGCELLYADNVPCEYVDGLCACGAKEPVDECEHVNATNRVVTFENNAINYNTVCTVCGEVVATETDASEDAATVAGTVAGFKEYAAIELTEAGTVAIPFATDSTNVKVAYVDGAKVVAANGRNSKTTPYDVLSVSYADGVANVTSRVTGVVIVYTLADSSALDAVLSSSTMQNTFALESDISMILKLKKSTVDSAGFDSYYIHVVHEGYNGNTPFTYEEDVLYYSSTDEADYHVFKYPIAAKQMNDDVNIYYYGVKDGVSYLLRVKVDFSVVAYARDTGYPLNDAELSYLLSDMLIYGATAQSYFGYNTDNLASEDNDLDGKVVGTGKTYTTEELTTMNISKSLYSDAAYKDKASNTRYLGFTKGLNLESRIEAYVDIKFATFVSSFNSAELDNMSFVLTYTDPSDGETKTENLTKEDFEINGTTYTYIFDKFPAKAMNNDFTITVNYNGEYYASTIYSINSYLANATNYNSTYTKVPGGASLGTLCKSIWAYGYSAEEYFNK